MAEEPIHVIRESTRVLLKLNRQQQRDEVSDVNRSMDEIRISTESVSNIALKLKTKTCITVSDLQMLKNGLMDDPNNQTIVLNTHGALRGLVRELTGHEVRKQCAAAGCLCNLALGDSRASNTIAKASGSYLVTALDNLTTELAVTCAWTIGNLAGSCPRVCELLISQGALSKLCDMLKGNDDVQDAALYALVHFAYQFKDELRVEHLIRMLQDLSKIQLTMSSSQLLFILSCHKHFPENITEDLLKKVLDDIPKTIDTHLSSCMIGYKGNSCCKLNYLFRILANMDTRAYSPILEYFITNNVSENLSKILSMENKSLCESLLWLLGNLFNYDGNNVFFTRLPLKCTS
ncbi:uncharacterized protein [Epargyreus clarus]|uniref:uncharacterized protein n=1 Tax=Epargyreus clarus TaxID=520877 RepID=UPI003C2E5B60